MTQRVAVPPPVQAPASPKLKSLGSEGFALSLAQKTARLNMALARKICRVGVWVSGFVAALAGATADVAPLDFDRLAAIRECPI